MAEADDHVPEALKCPITLEVCVHSDIFRHTPCGVLRLRRSGVEDSKPFPEARLVLKTCLRYMAEPRFSSSGFPDVMSAHAPLSFSCFFPGGRLQSTPKAKMFLINSHGHSPFL